MSGGARLGFLAAAIVVLVIAFVVLRPSSEDTELTADPPTPTPTASAAATSSAEPAETETPTPKPTVDPGPLLTGAKVVKLRYDKGETVRFRVRSPQDEEVHIHGYDIAKDLEPNQEITVSFPATIEGIFEIEYEHAGEQIGELRVEPN